MFDFLFLSFYKAVFMLGLSLGTKTPLLGLGKHLFFLAYRFWSQRTQLEMSWDLLENIRWCHAYKFG